MKIIICGDIHGEFNKLNKFINAKRPDMILQCGDFGYWPRFFHKTYLTDYGKIRKWQTVIRNKDCKIYWCDGNHEDHETLLKRETDELWPNVFYMPRGKTMLLPDGRNVLFMGGALSIDKDWRTPGHDWFPEETITQKDIMNLPDERVDIVITHTAPEYFKFNDPEFVFRKFPDPSRLALNYVFDKYRPAQWFCGHFHINKKGIYGDCNWTILGNIEGGIKYCEILQ